jgi:hypothetical protein
MVFEEYDGDALEFESNYVKRRADMTAKKNEMKENTVSGEQVKAMIKKQESLKQERIMAK